MRKQQRAFVAVPLTVINISRAGAGGAVIRQPFGAVRSVTQRSDKPIAARLLPHTNNINGRYLLAVRRAHPDPGVTHLLIMHHRIIHRERQMQHVRR